MKSERKALLVGLVALAMMFTGGLVSALLRHYFSGPVAKGLGFFAAFLVSSFVLKRFSPRKLSRTDLLKALGVCLLVGLLAFVWELLWPGH